MGLEHLFHSMMLPRIIYARVLVVQEESHTHKDDYVMTHIEDNHMRPLITTEEEIIPETPIPIDEGFTTPSELQVETMRIKVLLVN